jgi:hypothetical protein
MPAMLLVAFASANLYWIMDAFTDKKRYQSLLILFFILHALLLCLNKSYLALRDFQVLQIFRR